MRTRFSNCIAGARRGARWRSILVACLFGAALSDGFALDADEKPTNYVVTRWDAEEGLPHNSVRAIFQSRDGYLWVGTTAGLARFDGLSFTVFTAPQTPGLPSSQITSIAETRDGSLWIATSKGLARYQDGRFTGYGRADGLKADTINALCVAPDGSLWIGGREGITRWVDGKFINDLDTSGYDTLTMQHITVDRQHAVWVSLRSEVLRYADGKFTRFGRAEGLPARELRMICEDAEGRLIAVTQEGLHRLEGDRFVPFEQNAALSSQRVAAAVADGSGSLWIGSDRGLDRWARGKVETYVDAHGDKLAAVDVVFVDREGCLWLGSTAGLSRFTDRRGYTLGKDEGVLGAFGVAVQQSRDGSVWVSSWAGGVARFQNGTVKQYAVGAPLSHESVTNIHEAPDGTMWFGNRGSSLDHLEGDKVTTIVYQSGVATSRPVVAIYTGSDGEFLVGIASRGLLQLVDGQLVPVPEAAALASETVWAIHRTRAGRLIIGTSKGIFERGADRAWRPVLLPDLKQDLVVRAFLEDADGVLWLATGGLGLVRWAPDHARAYGMGEGMIDNTLYSVVDDDAGSLWVSSSRGMARFRRTELAELDRGAIARLNGTTLGRNDGLLSGATSGSGNPTAVRLADGRLMTVTYKGVAVVDPRRLQVNSQPPTVVIESVIADDQPLALTSGQGISVPRGTNRLDIRYTALSLAAPQRLRFRYQLEGSDPTWIEAGSEHSARYTRLAPGAYVFHVLACNNDGVWNEAGATLAITLQPLLYQTLWFRLAAFALLAAAIAGATGLRIRQLQRREQALARANVELDQRVRERTASLAEASGLLEAMLANSPDLIYFKDRASRFVRFSNACLPHYGVAEAAQLRGKTDADFYTAVRAQPALADEQEIIRTGLPIISKLEKETYPDGRVAWALTTKMPWRDGVGAIIGTFGITKDVTALKEAEARLAQERDQLRVLIDASPDTIYFKDAQSRFVLASRSEVQQTLARVPDLRERRAAQGLAADLPEPELLTGLTDFDTYLEADARAAFEDEQEIVRTGAPLVGKLEKQAMPGGKVRWVLSCKMPWRDPEGKIIGTFGISKDITDLKEAEEKLSQVHRQLLETSRQAGRAEVATNVLHNVGNVLNSINVSVTLLAEHRAASESAHLAKACALLRRHEAELGPFFHTDPKGRQILGFLETLSGQFAAENVAGRVEIDSLRRSVEHVREIIAMQQSHARVSGLAETLGVDELVEEALRMSADALARHEIEVVLDFQVRPQITVEKHKVLQILVNLIRNAKDACDESGHPDKRIILRITSEGAHVQLAVIDNGVGIPAPNLTRIFAHGFTTRKNGHGFGLHSGALAARELGGSLQAASDGPGQGATFTLELPASGPRPEPAPAFATAELYQTADRPTP